MQAIFKVRNIFLGKLTSGPVNWPSISLNGPSEDTAGMEQAQ